jgi:uracil-DNA glycosylase
MEAIEFLPKKRPPNAVHGCVGKLAIGQFLDELPMLTELVGKTVTVEKFGTTFDLVPLPHPSGASPWHRIEPGKTLTKQALALIANHPAWINRA